MLSEPSIAKLIAGPLEALGVSPRRRRSLALVHRYGAVHRRPDGGRRAGAEELGDLLAAGRGQAGGDAAARLHRRLPPVHHATSTTPPTASVRRFGLEPAEELASARGPQELVALARHSAKEGALEADTAELFVRTLNLADLTAENVMTPRVQVIALDVQATAEDVANATRATGLSRFPVYRGSLDSVVGIAHIKDVLAVPAERRARTPGLRAACASRCSYRSR